MVSKSLVEEKLASLRAQFKQLEANLNAVVGAIQFAEQLLAEFNKSDVLPKDDNS